MKKLLALILAGTLMLGVCLTLTACGDSNEAKNDDSTAAASVAVDENKTETDDESSVATDTVDISEDEDLPDGWMDFTAEDWANASNAEKDAIATEMIVSLGNIVNSDFGRSFYAMLADDPGNQEIADNIANTRESIDAFFDTSSTSTSTIRDLYNQSLNLVATN